ncbi:MAG: glycosyltransferase family 4 protein [Thermomicrobiales bacterium]|nr:glycosyltransferase family 4 protein [Thermomicrobiales bacterium]MCO5221216.1 glycosyltransferase family 4 protein [Thermomicrobiales bacterium]
MAELDSPESIAVYLNAASPPTHLRLPGTPVLRPARRFWTIRALSAEMQRNPPDVLFVPAHVIPPVHPRSVVTIHDLGYLVEPDCHDPRHRRQLAWSTRWNCRAANGIIAVSHQTRRDLIELLGVHPEKIRVIYHGVDTRFSPATDAAVAQIRAELALPDRFVLAVGSLHSRKNLGRLIAAFERLAPAHPELGLVLVGSPGWNAESIFERIAQSPFRTRIRAPGFVRNDQLPALYSAAAVMAFVSLYEGFGLPVVESMACGTPVVTSERSSLPEIGGDAALLVDPTDVDAIAAGIDRVLSSAATGQELRTRGLARARSFSWQDCAKETLVFLRSIRDNS